MHDIAELQTLTTEYNGWSNRETWVVNLRLGGDECHYRELCSIIKHFEEDEQAEELEQYVRWLVDTDERVSITSDLLTTSLGRVNWYEIVESNRE